MAKMSVMKLCSCSNLSKLKYSKPGVLIIEPNSSPKWRNKNCTIRGVFRKKSVYTVAIVFSGLTLQGFNVNDLILIFENLPLLLKNINPTKVSAIPRRILANYSGAPTGENVLNALQTKASSSGHGRVEHIEASK